MVGIASLISNRKRLDCCVGPGRVSAFSWESVSNLHPGYPFQTPIRLGEQQGRWGSIWVFLKIVYPQIIQYWLFLLVNSAHVPAAQLYNQNFWWETPLVKNRRFPSKHEVSHQFFGWQTTGSTTAWWPARMGWSHAFGVVYDDFQQGDHFGRRPRTHVEKS